MEALMLFFKKNALTLGLISGGAGLVIILIIYLISIIFNKPISFNMGPIKLNLAGNKKKNQDNETISKIRDFLFYWQTTDTGHVALLDSLVSITRDKTQQKDIIKLKESITKQMLAAEDTNISIKSLLTNKYADLLKSKMENGKDVKQHKDYRYYQVLVTTILDDVKRKTLKDSLYNTDILRLTDSEFSLFVEQKSTVIITIISDYLDFMYNSNSMVSSDEVRDINKDLEGEIKVLIKDLYNQIKVIIKEDAELMDSIDKMLSDDIEKIKEKFVQGCAVKNIEKLINVEDKEK